MLALLAPPSHAHADEPAPKPRPEAQGFDAVDTSLVKHEGDPLEGFEGKPVRSIRVVTTGAMWKSRPTITSIKLGDPLDGTLVRKAMRELVDSGAFAQVDVKAEAQADGVALVLFALPRRTIASIKLEGNALERSRTLGAADLTEGGEITEPALREAKTKIRSLYQRYGYDDARVELTTSETDNPTEVLLTITIEPGDKKHIARRIFVIEPRYDRVVGDLKYQYGVETGDAIDEDELIDADNDLADDLREAGFIDASVKHRVLRKGELAFLYVYLETGPQYRFRFQGNRRYEASEIEEGFGLKTGNVDASPDSLSQQITTFYRQRGLFDVRVEATENRSKDDAVREMVFRIHEGKLVRVAKRIFPCMPKEPPSGLSASDISSEIDAFLDEELPSMPLFHQIDELAIDAIQGGGGARADARRLEPAATYVPESYDRALEHVRKLLNSRGYLNAVVGPVSLIRAECDPRGRGGICRPIPMPKPKPAQCRRRRGRASHRRRTARSQHQLHPRSAAQHQLRAGNVRLHSRAARPANDAVRHGVRGQRCAQRSAVARDCRLSARRALLQRGARQRHGAHPHGIPKRRLCLCDGTRRRGHLARQDPRARALHHQRAQAGHHHGLRDPGRGANRRRHDHRPPGALPEARRMHGRGEVLQARPGASQRGTDRHARHLLERRHQPRRSGDSAAAQARDHHRGRRTIAIHRAAPRLLHRRGRQRRRRIRAPQHRRSRRSA